MAGGFWGGQGMGLRAAQLFGPLGSENGVLVKESRKLAGEAPQVFVKTAAFWLAVEACLVALRMHFQSPFGGRVGMGGSLPSEIVLAFINLTVALFAVGWLSRWALHRMNKEGTLSTSESPVYTLQPGIWAGLSSLNFLAAAARFVELILSMGGLSPAVSGAIYAGLGFAATFFGLRAIGAFYGARSPALFVWSVLWPILAFIGTMLILAVVLGRMGKVGGL